MANWILPFAGGFSEGYVVKSEKARDAKADIVKTKAATMTSEGLRLLRERRATKKTLQDRMDELASFGITGNAAWSVLRLSDKRYSDFVTRAYNAGPEATLELTGKEIAKGQIIEDKGDDPIWGETVDHLTEKSTQMEHLGIFGTGVAEGVKQPTREEIIQGIMGTIPAHIASKKELSSLETAMRRHFGKGDTTRMAMEQAAATVGVPVHELQTMMQGNFEFAAAPKHIKLKMIKTEAEKRAIETAEQEIELTKLNLEKARHGAAITSRDEFVLTPGGLDKRIRIPAGSVTNNELLAMREAALIQAQTQKYMADAGLVIKRADFGLINKLVGIESTSLIKSKLSPKNRNDVVSDYNEALGQFTTYYVGSLEAQDTQRWLKLSTNYLTYIAENSYIKDRNYVSMSSTVRTNASFALNMAAVDSIRKNNPQLSDEDIKNDLLNNNETSEALKMFFSGAVSDYVLKFFDKSKEERKKIDDSLDNMFEQERRAERAFRTTIAADEEGGDVPTRASSRLGFRMMDDLTIDPTTSIELDEEPDKIPATEAAREVITTLTFKKGETIGERSKRIQTALVEAGFRVGSINAWLNQVSKKDKNLTTESLVDNLDLLGKRTSIEKVIEEHHGTESAATGVGALRQRVVEAGALDSIMEAIASTMDEFQYTDEHLKDQQIGKKLNVIVGRLVNDRDLNTRIEELLKANKVEIPSSYIEMNNLKKTYINEYINKRLATGKTNSLGSRKK